MSYKMHLVQAQIWFLIHSKFLFVVTTNSKFAKVESKCSSFTKQVSVNLFSLQYIKYIFYRSIINCWIATTSFITKFFILAAKLFHLLSSQINTVKLLHMVTTKSFFPLDTNAKYYYSSSLKKCTASKQKKILLTYHLSDIIISSYYFQLITCDYTITFV